VVAALVSYVSEKQGVPIEDVSVESEAAKTVPSAESVESIKVNFAFTVFSNFYKLNSL